jgi:uncharacterized membrane protein YhaH (DUF805 family)
LGERIGERINRVKSGLLGGRSSRKEYWLSVVIIMATSYVLSYLPGFASAVGLAALLMIMQIRRAHDFGRSGWWGVLAQVAPLAVLFLPIAFDDMTLYAVIPAAVGIMILGVIPDDAGENRFGPPPPRQLRAMFRRR